MSVMPISSAAPVATGIVQAQVSGFPLTPQDLSARLPEISNPLSVDKPVDRAEIEKAVKVLNVFTEAVAQNVRFSIDDESGKTIVKVVDNETMEVLRQFPSEEALSIARSVDKMQGLLIRTKA